MEEEVEDGVVLEEILAQVSDPSRTSSFECLSGLTIG